MKISQTNQDLNFEFDSCKDYLEDREKRDALQVNPIRISIRSGPKTRKISRKRINTAMTSPRKNSKTKASRPVFQGNTNLTSSFRPIYNEAAMKPKKIRPQSS